MTQFSVTGEFHGREVTVKWRDGVMTCDNYAMESWVRARSAQRIPVSIPGLVSGLASVANEDPPLALATIVSSFPDRDAVSIDGDAFEGEPDDDVRTVY